MTSQSDASVELLPESERVDPQLIFIPEAAKSDPAELIQGLFDWINFLREECCYQTDALAPAARALYHAAGYHYGVNSNFHALYFHNLHRNGVFDETMHFTQAGLAKLPVAALLENCVEAMRRYRDRQTLWDETFSGTSAAHAAAKAIMHDVDQRYVEIDRAYPLERLLADAILALPNVRLIPPEAYADVRERALRSHPDRIARLRELQAREEQRQANERAADAARVRRSLYDDVEFAAELLATGAGYMAVIAIEPATTVDDGDGVISSWPVILRRENGTPQHNYLVQGHGKFALFDFQQENVRGVLSERDVTRQRQALLRQTEPSPPPSGIRRLFGRKSAD